MNGVAVCGHDGVHVGELDGFPPTGRPLRERAGAVYRVGAAGIGEYRIQIDGAGIARRVAAARPTV